MKSTYRIIGFVLLGVAASAVTGVICKIRRQNALRRLVDSADEGYETAHDIIYPDKFSSKGSRKLKYGPVY